MLMSVMIVLFLVALLMIATSSDWKSKIIGSILAATLFGTVLYEQNALSVFPNVAHLQKNVIYERISTFDLKEKRYAVLLSQFEELKLYQIDFKEDANYFKFDGKQLVPFTTGGLFD